MARKGIAAIDRRFHRLDKTVRRMEAVSSSIIILTEILMGDQKQLTDEIESLKQAVADDESQDQVVVDALNKTIADLQAQVSAGFDTQPFIDSLEQIKGLLVPAGGSGGGSGSGSGGTPSASRRA